MSSEDGLKVYAIRFTPIANAETQLYRARIAAANGEEVADDWERDFDEVISHLATGQYRPLAVESALFTIEVRAFTFRRPGIQSGYRVLFTIREETLDGPQVWVLHIRYGSAAPMQAYEARNIEADLERM